MKTNDNPQAAWGGTPGEELFDVLVYAPGWLREEIERVVAQGKSLLGECIGTPEAAVRECGNRRRMLTAACRERRCISAVGSAPNAMRTARERMVGRIAS